MKAVLMLIGIMVLSGLPTRANPPPVASVEISEGHLIVNGEPFFPVHIHRAAHWHEALPEAGEKGFNLVQTYGTDPQNPHTFRADINDAYANGMYAHVSLNGLCEKLELVEQIVMACRDAPGLLLWELQDEPNLRLPEPADKPYAERPYRLPPEKLKPVYDLIKRLDPAHPVWVNLAHGFLRDHQDYRDVADIHSDDVYPVPSEALTRVAAYADTVVEAAAGKPSWLVLQMAPVRPHILGDDDRHPTIAEVRCMTYMAVAHGISGVGYYSFNERPQWQWRVNESAPAYWAQWADLTAELRCLAPYLLAPEAPGEIEADIIEGSKEAGAWGYTALHLSLRQTESGYFLIAVNGFNSPIKARFTVPGTGSAPHAAVRFEGRLVEVEDGAFEDLFAPYDVHLYELPLSVVGGND